MLSGPSWADKPLTNREFYSAATWGPVAADDLLAQSGHVWHEPVVNHSPADPSGAASSQQNQIPAAMAAA